jgi:phosphatidylethanolamine/phosphatidyl-N-methylethanolamine N-methyltransferase
MHQDNNKRGVFVEENQIRKAENRLFFRRWIKNPRQLGTLAPISVKLANLAAQTAFKNYKPGTPVIEIGAGTGRLTRALLQRGIRLQDLSVVELDGEMCDFLRKTIPSLNVIEGDATELSTLIPDSMVGHVGVVVSAIPLMYLGTDTRKNLINAAFDVLQPNAEIIHVTYNNKSPLKFWDHVEQSRAAATWFNIPPGFVWRFRQI